jgi:sugar O-acyltransferase (sialic acid O-acetyltransferase NeuD family)
MKSKKLIIVGDSAFAEIAHEYFEFDSAYEVVAFSVERSYLKRNSMRGLPIIAYDELESHFEPSKHEVFVAIVYTQLNRLRTRLASDAKLKGYKLASYISSRAFVWRNVKLGEHCFIFEDNTLQPFVQIGNNVVLWSGNHIGHHSTIHNNCFISSHVVISGFCNLGEYCFLGVNATVANNVNIASDNWIGPGVTIMSDTSPGSLFKSEHSVTARVSTMRFFKIKE